jgi:RNA-splicing ligase RtcB
MDLKIFTNNIEEKALEQINTLAKLEAFKNSKIRIMPDVHAGKGCVIGFTADLGDRVIPNIVGVDIGCVDRDTEYLTINGWKKISSYDGEEILTYDLNNNLSYFTTPKAYIKNECSKFYHFKTKYGIDQMVSSEHKCLVRRGSQNRKPSRDLPYTISAEDIYKKHTNRKLGFRDNFVCDVPNIKNNGLNFTNEELRIIIMYQADGFTKHTTNLLTVKFKNDRKIKRCRMLLNNANIDFIEKKGKEETTFKFRFDYSFKNLGCLYGLNKNQLAIICDEVMHWDGSKNSMQYTSTIKENVDFVQYAFICNGHRTSIDQDKRSYKYKNGECWRVTISKRKPRVQLAGSPKTPIKIIDSKDGFKYCFTTETGFWVMRRNGCICLTGNCGMYTVELNDIDINLEELDRYINKNIPSGFEQNQIEQDYSEELEEKIKEVCKLLQIDDLRQRRAIGSLGGGNHFVEIDVDEDNNKYLVIHTGSRNFGYQVAKYHQDLAVVSLKHKIKCLKNLRNKEIGIMKQNGRESETQSIINIYDNVIKEYESIPKELSYLDGELRDNYLSDMKVCQEFARENREVIAKKIIGYLGLDYNILNKFHTVHNYIDLDTNIVRKGAISAKLGEKVLIPINMRDGSILAIGKGNKDWNNSAPHGAGRIMSRTQAKNEITLDEFKKSMKKVYTTSVCTNTIDECPMAYKPIEEIISNIKDSVEIIDVLKPIYNFKAKE